MDSLLKHGLSILGTVGGIKFLGDEDVVDRSELVVFACLVCREKSFGHREKLVVHLLYLGSVHKLIALSREVGGVCLKKCSG